MTARHTHIIGVALVTQQDLDRLGRGFARWFPVDETPCFGEPLRAIDDADRELRHLRDPAMRMPPAR